MSDDVYRLTDRYGRTVADLMQIFAKQHLPWGQACTDPDCPSWVLGSDGIFWMHIHPDEEVAS